VFLMLRTIDLGALIETGRRAFWIAAAAGIASDLTSRQMLLRETDGLRRGEGGCRCRDNDCHGNENNEFVNESYHQY
jgi:hypothetical protein